MIIWLQRHLQKGRASNTDSCGSCATWWKNSSSSGAGSSYRRSEKLFESFLKSCVLTPKQAKHKPVSRGEEQKAQSPLCPCVAYADLAAHKENAVKAAVFSLQAWLRQNFPWSQWKFCLNEKRDWSSMSLASPYPCRATHCIQEGYASSSTKPMTKLILKWF